MRSRKKYAPTEKQSEPAMWLRVKAPVEFFELLDKWREQWKIKNDRVMAPTRPDTVRWIVYQFLLKQEARAQRRRPRKK
jgi:hypothetical protein